MKRGIYGLILVLTIILTPIVFANPLSDLLLGSSQDSVIFLKIIYSVLIFTIFFSVLKKSVFKENKEAKFAQILALIFAIFAFRFTPDSLVSGFGWFIMIIGPFFVLYQLAGVFIKQTEGKFSWGKFIFALIGTLIAWFAYGSSVSLGHASGYSTGLGFFDEFFAGVNYLTFSKGGIVFIGFIIGLAILAMVSLVSRLRGTGANGTTNFGDFGKYFFIVLGIVLLIFLVSLISGGGFASIPALFSALGSLGSWWWLALPILILILFAIPQTRGYVRTVFSALWRAIAAVFRALWGLLSGLGRGLRGAGRGLWNFSRGRNLFIEIETPTQRGANRVTYDSRRNGTPNSFSGPLIIPTAGSTTQVFFNFYMGRTRRTASRLQNAQVTLNNINNGTFNPPNGSTTNGTVHGLLRSNYSAPAVASNANLRIGITHADIDPLFVMDNLAIIIGTIQNLNVIANVPPITIISGQRADILIQVFSLIGAGPNFNGVDGATVTINFPGFPAITPMTNTTSSGGPNITSRVTLQTPVLNIPAGTTGSVTYNYNLRVTAPGFAPFTRNAIPILVNPVSSLPTLRINPFNVVNANTLAPIAPSGTPSRIRIRARQNIRFEFILDDGAATPTIVNNATITMNASPSSAINPTIPRFITGTGRYRGEFNPVAADVGKTFDFLVNATATGYNPTNGNLEVEVEDNPLLNITTTFPTTPLPRINTDYPFIITVTDPAGANVPSADLVITATPQGRSPIVIATVKTNATGQYNAVFRPIFAGPYTIKIEASKTDYKTNNIAPIINVLNLDSISTINIQTRNITTSAIISTRPAQININDQLEIIATIYDSSGNPINDPLGTIRFIPSNTLLTTANGNFATGNFTTTFASPNPIDITYQIIINIPGYNPVPPQSLRIVVIDNSEISATVDWFPDPTNSNRKVLMNFLIVNSLTAAPLNNATIRITDSNPNHVYFSQAIPLKTNPAGTLNNTLEIDLGRPLAINTLERHKLKIDVSHPNFVRTKSESIEITFRSPGSTLGGPKSLTF